VGRIVVGKAAIARERDTMIRQLPRHAALLALAVCVLAVGGTSRTEARDIVDMTGRKVTVPDRIQKVYCASPPATYLLYSFDRSLLAGLNYPLAARDGKYVPKDLASLPILGGWFGQGKTPNLESIMAVKPDIMIVWERKDSALNDKIEETAQRLCLPIVYMRLNELRQYPEAILFMGNLLDRSERARTLSEYAERKSAEVEKLVAGIPEQRKVSVYYAEDPDGLSTECDRSWHVELINLAGGRNIYQCNPRDGYGMERITLEQVKLKNPEVMIVQEQPFLEKLYGDPRWQDIAAVKNRRVHLVPRSPFNWFDRPPSFMRLIGLQWVVKILYPDLFQADLVEETRRFHKLFLDLDLEVNEACDLLGL
jgi:iron complex transport system substrate-binding protein